MTDAKDNWRSIRGTRASPPAIAGQDDERRHVYQAALQQAEELWEAAAAVGTASRPLPLFYAMSQAGLAVCAAWTPEVAWRPMKHGLRRHVSEAMTPEERVFEHATSVINDPLGRFGMVARATESETFDGRASVSDLWVSLPEFRTPTALVGDRPRCLSVKAVTLPEDDRPTFQRLGSPIYGTFLPGTTEVTPNGYPTLQGMELQGVRQGVLFQERIYRFPHDDGSFRPLWHIGERNWEPGDPVRNLFVVRPGIGENAASLPSEFLTLWALLFCLSELARYYPDTWVGALNPDTSAAAVTLEHGLDVALTKAPELIARAVRGPIAQLTREMVDRMERDLRQREELGGAGGETGVEAPAPGEPPQELSD